MMKKLFTAAVLLTAIGAANAQGHKVKRAELSAEPQLIRSNTSIQVASRAASMNIADTLWYFYNKQRFINAPADQGFYTISGSVGTSTNGDLIEFGSSFLNTGGAAAPVTVSEAIFLASREANSTNSVVPVRVYLYNATNAGVPTTKVDSADVNVTGSTPQFWIASFNTPQTINGSFFVSYRVMPMSAGDTLLAWVTSAATSTAGSSWAASEKFGEGLSYTRYYVSNPTVFNQMFSNTNFYGSANGFDLEAVVVPIVSFSINANFTAAAPNATATPGAYCTNQGINFTNTTNPNSLVYNRQFNFNRFITYWNTAPNPGFSFSITPDPADPIDNWVFSNNAAVTVTTTNASNTLTAPGNFNTTLSIMHRPFPYLPTTQKPSVPDIKTASYTVVSCQTATYTSIGSLSLGFEALNIYPNPTAAGKTTISGLNGNNTVLVYDMLGQLVSSMNTEKELVAIDLAGKANGNYFVKIVNAENHVKVVKIVNQN